jgi:hypothetical protein
VFRRLRLLLADRVRWRRMFGILFDSDDDPAPDPAAELAWYRRHLAEITTHTEAPVPVCLEWLTGTSWPASLAAKAAESQGADVGERVLRRLRETTFVLGRPADTAERVLAAVSGIKELDQARLADDMASAAVLAAVRADWRRAREPWPELLELDAQGPHPGRAKPTDDGYRFALPTLLFEGPSGRVAVPGWRPLSEYTAAIAQVAPDLDLTWSVLDADDALDRFQSLSVPDLKLLTGGIEAPANGVLVNTGNGPLWLCPTEFAGHPVSRA